MKIALIVGILVSQIVMMKGKIDFVYLFGFIFGVVVTAVVLQWLGSVFH